MTNNGWNWFKNGWGNAPLSKAVLKRVLVAGGSWLVKRADGASACGLEWYV
jgi:hypothetical protein